MPISDFGSAGRVSPNETAHPSVVFVRAGYATVVLGVVGTAMIMLSTTTSIEAIPILMIAAVGFGQAAVLRILWPIPVRYRLVFSFAMLAIFLTAFIPRLLEVTPMGLGSALALGVAGSLPMFGIAAWLLRAAQRRSPTQPSR